MKHEYSNQTQKAYSFLQIDSRVVRIKDTTKHLRLGTFVNIVNIYKPLVFVKMIQRTCFAGPQMQLF